MFEDKVAVESNIVEPCCASCLYWNHANLDLFCEGADAIYKDCCDMYTFNTDES